MVTERVSVPGPFVQGNNDSYRPDISANGLCVVFYSFADNLVAADNNQQPDIFLHDRETGALELISVATDGTQGNSSSYAPAVSSDGRFVAFGSGASNLVPGDTNGCWDVFVRDRQNRTTERVSVSSTGEQANGACEAPAISWDGRYVAFTSLATNLVESDTNSLRDAFVHDRQTHETERVSVASDGSQANGECGPWCAISGDGRYVAFYSTASNLVDGDTNGCWDVFVHDRQTRRTERVSVASDGSQGNGPSGYWGVALSEHGECVAFHSAASNLVPDDTNGCWDAFVRSRLTGETERVSISSQGVQGDGHTAYAGIAISGGGRFVAFYSYAGNLVDDDTNGARDVFVRDRQASVTTRVSVSTEGAQSVETTVNYSVLGISADGRYVAYTFGGGGLVHGDTNNDRDVFVTDRAAVPVSGAKKQGDAAAVIVSAAVCTAVLPGEFWIAQDRLAALPGCGIRVEWSGAVAEGKRYVVSGTMRTGANGERYIEATDVQPLTSDWALPASPYAMGIAAVGGGDWQYDRLTGAGQRSVFGGCGLNNIGLLVRTWGRVQSPESGRFVLNAGLPFPSEEAVVVLPAGASSPAEGAFAVITGISSCEVDPEHPGEFRRLIRARRAEDVFVMP